MRVVLAFAGMAFGVAAAQAAPEVERPPQFVAIAFDAGGVATGPIANSFLLALALGASSAAGQEPMAQGLGLVALIAVAPIVSVMALGMLVRRQQRKEA